MPCTIAVSPYLSLIQRYFPSAQWEIANCLSLAECCPDRQDYPHCVTPQGSVVCGGEPVTNASSYGLFGLVDACWNPAMNASSPFTPAQWAQVLDPEMNTWMASVVYSLQGWSAWTSCSSCPDSCTNPGPPPAGERWPVPFPNAPAPPEQERPSVLLTLAPILVGAGVYVLLASQRRR